MIEDNGMSFPEAKIRDIEKVIVIKQKSPQWPEMKIEGPINEPTKEVQEQGNGIAERLKNWQWHL